jgi:hypothetical protein
MSGDALTALAAKWRAMGKHIQSFHATMGNGWIVCADELDALIAAHGSAAAVDPREDPAYVPTYEDGIGWGSHARGNGTGTAPWPDLFNTIAALKEISVIAAEGYTATKMDAFDEIHALADMAMPSR